MPEKGFGADWTKGDRGIPILAIQSSASAATVSNGQYTPLIVDEVGQLRVAANVTLGANQSVNVSQVGGQTAATAGAGILSIGIGASGNSVIGSLTANQSVNVAQLSGQTPATAGAGILKIGADIFQVGGNATVTASAGIMKVNSIDAFDIATIYSSGSAKKPTFLQISASASGSNVLIASAASTSYVILAYNFMTNGAVNVQFLSSATPMGGIAYCPTAGIGKVAPFSPVGWMQATAGHPLNINLSANVAVGGELVYIAI